jgi:co-chaperonin GroES (HSP10)
MSAHDVSLHRSDYSLRPLGTRILVRRYPLADQSAGGIHVIGRDYPTLGRVLRVGSCQTEIRCGDEVQWAVKPGKLYRERNWDEKGIPTCLVAPPDTLLLEADDINIRIGRSGLAHAVGNRVLISPLPSNGLLTEPSVIQLGRPQTHWACGQIKSRGILAINREWEIPLDTIIVYDANVVSELRFDGKLFHVVRDEDCILALNPSGEILRQWHNEGLAWR